MTSKFFRSRGVWLAVGALAIVAAVVGVQWSRSQPQPNIILVTFDTTRADHMGAYGFDGGLTDAFDEFARHGVLFEQAYAPCPITLPSHATMLTGLYPPEHDLRVNGAGRLSSEIPFLPEILKEHGYETGAFIAAAPVLGAQFGLNRGFDRYDDDPARTSARTRPYGGERRDGEEVADLALEWLEQRTDKPFFCWIHFYDAHGPYDPYEDIYGEQFRENPYEAGVAWEVRQFERVNSFLKERNLDSETLVVVAGDHGEGLDDHGEHEHGYLVYNSTLHVPLVFAGLEGLQAGTRIPSAVSLVDLMPTILDILGIPVPEDISGETLLPALKGEPIESRDCYAEAELPFFLNRWCPLRAVISDRWKFIQSTRPELYDLEKDPGELTNLLEGSSDEREWLEELLASMQDSFHRVGAETVELSEKDLADLQSLGYVSGGTASEDGDSSTADEELLDVKDMIPFIAKYEEAKHMTAEDQLDEAIRLLQEVADGTDQFPLSDTRLGDLLAQDGRQDEALEIYRSVLERRPDFHSVQLKAGRMLADQGKFEEAAGFFRQVTKVHPEDVSGHMELAQVLTSLQQFDEAVTEYQEALRLSPQLVGAHVGLAQLQIMRGQAAEAVVTLEKALENHQKNVPLQENLMMALVQAGQLGKAVQVGLQVVQQTPESFETRFNLGLLLVQSRRIPEGLAQLREAQRLRPSDPRPTQQIQRIEAALQGGQ